MRPPDTQGREDAAWAAFVQHLADQLAALWPAMHERLGERYGTFIELASQQALLRGITLAAGVARFANLYVVWGPAFHDKPGFEWAQGLLAAPREREWATLHQLVQRSLLELERMPDARIQPAALLAADAYLVAAFSHLGRHGALSGAEPPALPLQACDLEAMELRLLESAVAEQYVMSVAQAGTATTAPAAPASQAASAPGAPAVSALLVAWQRQPLPLPPPVRVDAANPVPPLLAVLSHASGVLPQARVQLRARGHAGCQGGALHPALHFAGSHGLWQWEGYETKAVSWPVTALAQPLAAAGAGSAIAEETSPDIFKLDLQVCGLRDDGDALGTQSSQLWVWPAEQWWLELERKAPAAQPVVAGRHQMMPASTRCRVERDGALRDSAALRGRFEQGLEDATAAALQKLLAAISAIDGVSAPRLDGMLALLLGRASFTWGWQLGAAGMAGRAFMRVLGALDMQACQAELQAEAELALDGGRARLVLHCDGSAPLRHQIRREAAEPPLLATLLPAKLAFTLPWTAELVPLATDTGSLLQAAGPCTGALAGEAGLRPRTSGGSGWEWFATLKLEAASLPVLLADPVLGLQQRNHRLWPEQTLLDWSLG